MLVIPTLLAVGLADRWLVGTTGVVERFVGSGARVLTASAPPGHAATVVGLRFLALFAFLQTMHYVVWVAFLPKFAIDASQTFEARMPWLTVRRLWTLGGVAALFLGVLFLTDYVQGKAVEAALASYHGQLEFPVLLALLLGGQQVIGSAGPPGFRVGARVRAPRRPFRRRRTSSRDPVNPLRETASRITFSGHEKGGGQIVSSHRTREVTAR